MKNEIIMKTTAIMVYDVDLNNLLMCRRTKEPYLGLYNLVGGKIDLGEEHIDSAYRELEEETGINRDDISLLHFMNFDYFDRGVQVDVYLGILNKKKELVEEVNPLVWMPLDSDFSDSSLMAGEGSIAHMLNMAAIQIPELQQTGRPLKRDKF